MMAASLSRRWYVVVALGWLIRYLTLGHVPFWQTPIWHDWADQSRYLASTTALAHGDLSASAHWYPLGYPLVAVPFARVVPNDPFFLADLALYLLTCLAFRRVTARIAIGRDWATAIFLATTLLQHDVASGWVQPWTSTLSAALIWWLVELVLAASERDDGREEAGRLVAIGALSAALPLTRPVDASLSLICLAAFAASVVAARRPLVRPAAWVVLGGLAVSLPYAALYLAIYGPHQTDYMAFSARIGFVWGDLGWKAYVLLVDPRPWFPDSEAILKRLPWIVPGCAGLIAAVATRGRGRRAVALLLGLIAAGGVPMIAYADLQPPGLWRFGNIHYFAWMMPVFGAGLFLLWRSLTDRRARLAAAIALAVFLPLLTVRIFPVPVDDGHPARMLFFDSKVGADWGAAYFARATIADGEGRLLNVVSFHQLPDRGRVRAIATHRPFAQHPRRTDPDDPAARAPQSPSARFGERLAWAWSGD